MGGTAEAADFLLSSPMVLEFDPGTTAVLAGIGIGGDFVDEHDETVDLMLSGAGNALLAPAASNHMLTIVDDDDSPSIGFSLEHSTIGENAGTVSLRVELAGNETEKDVAVDYATTSGSALTGLDFGAAHGTAVIQSPNRFKDIDCSIVNDTAIEGPEQFFLDLANVQNGTLGTSHCTIAIDDDEKPTAAEHWGLYE